MSHPYIYPLRCACCEIRLDPEMEHGRDEEDNDLCADCFATPRTYDRAIARADYLRDVAKDRKAEERARLSTGPTPPTPKDTP